jgi:hypothetical protein
MIDRKKEKTEIKISYYSPFTSLVRLLVAHKLLARVPEVTWSSLSPTLRDQSPVCLPPHFWSPAPERQRDFRPQQWKDSEVC